LGLIFYGLALVLYAAALVRLPMNVAHPILTSGAIAIVAAASVVAFGEPFSWIKGVGIMLIAGGVALITSQAN
jgi:multidrug transporter EmrE-like cation transporter